VDGDPNAAALAAAIQAAGYGAAPLELLQAGRPHSNDAIRYRLPVEGMTCADCERHVTEVLQGAGATDIEANFRQGEARFTTPKTIEPSRFVAGLAGTPYRPGTPEPLMPESAPARRSGRPSGDRFDLAIVGSGAAAFAAAIAATERGAKVVMIEGGTLGGTCVNVGCVPSKTQLRAGELYLRAGHPPFGGIEAVDLARLVEEKDQLVNSLRREKCEDLIGEYGWQLLRGEARFEDHRTLRVGDQVISTDGFVLATGARPKVPPIANLDQVDYLTSASLLDLKVLPKHLIVVGRDTSVSSWASYSAISVAR
jgi:mercuric reductase